MKISDIKDIGFSDIKNEQYDIAVFSSGYESRSTSFPRSLRVNAGSICVLGFSDFCESKIRDNNDRYYTKELKAPPILIGGNNDSDIYGYLNDKFDGKNGDLNILVDYSSMTRNWYAAIINWCRFYEGAGKINLDFVYSIGKYMNKFEPMVISEISSLPGFEGVSLSGTQSVLVFGIGFESEAAMCVYERLEPNIVYSYVADPAASQRALDRSLDSNKELIDLSQLTLRLPIKSVCETYKYLSELIKPHIKDMRVTIVPMGPKPHVLAALMICTMFPEVTCLRASGRGAKMEDVRASGEYVVTRLSFC